MLYGGSAKIRSAVAHGVSASTARQSPWRTVTSLPMYFSDIARLLWLNGSGAPVAQRGRWHDGRGQESTERTWTVATLTLLCRMELRTRTRPGAGSQHAIKPVGTRCEAAAGRRTARPGAIGCRLAAGLATVAPSAAPGPYTSPRVARGAGREGRVWAVGHWGRQDRGARRPRAGREGAGTVGVGGRMSLL